ncbi:endolytic transglycosylase MltG [Pseudaeromonas sp. ZJS20]|uniref:endolytic transglycosylase MltG n=1 Tax=Pseudaeromonas aegiceratis TaxID=3153928 RepID=UPI00390C4385
MTLKRRISLLCLLGLLLVASLLGWGYLQWQRLERMPVGEVPALFSVTKGERAGGLVHRLAAEPVPGWAVSLWLKTHPELTAIRSGTFALQSGMSLKEALSLIVAGKEYLLNVTLVEGQRLADWRKTLAHLPHGVSTLTSLDDAALAEAVGCDCHNLEGLLMPETYAYTVGMTDLEIVKRAYQHMQHFLAQAWEARAADLPYKTPYEALILASIIEKETAQASERPLIASVFVNRLRRGMKLQTDPTVIYGIGERYDGNIRRRDLQDANPYNTYVIDGLPPTPIAMPSRQAIEAALHPADSDYLYFVAKGEGWHQFSKSLSEHNAAVRRYILRRQ